MTMTQENPRLMSFLRCHAQACRSLRKETENQYRITELVKIIRICESEYPLFREFRQHTPECREISKIIDAKTCDIS